MQDKYWTLIDHFESTRNNEFTSHGGIYTYEHKLPGGKLILTEHRWNGRLAATVIFVADAETEKVAMNTGCTGVHDDGIADGNLTRCSSISGCGLPGCPYKTDVLKL